MPGREALSKAGIEPPDLGPKDAIALLNANAYSIGTGALALHDAGLALQAQTAAGALSLEAAGANLSPTDPRVVALRPAPGQVAASQLIRSLIKGSDLLKAKHPRRVQDPLSFRCLAPVNGAAFDQLARATAAVLADLNGAGDSPAVLVDDEELMSTVNFDTTATSLAFEGLGLALSHTAAIATLPHRQADVARLLRPAALPHPQGGRGRAPASLRSRRPPRRWKPRFAISLCRSAQ